ncbi:MAG: YggT family protein [Gammaproteobacteria bacterium]
MLLAKLARQLSGTHHPFISTIYIRTSTAFMNNTASALQFLIGQLFDLYSYVILARFLLQLVRADFYNPISQFVVKATNPLLLPLRKVIPGFLGLDWSALVLLWAFQTLKIVLLVLIAGLSVHPVNALIGSLIGCVSLTIGFYLFIIFVQIILSWVAPYQQNPMSLVLHQLSEPLLGPARRLLPPIAGLDISPILVILMLSTLKVFLVG